MYTVDSRDTVVELTDVPPPDVGAPLPFVWADDTRLILEYLVQQHDPNWDGAYTTIVSPNSTGSVVAIVRFSEPYAHMFGPPNDEALHGHPLASRGLSSYAVFEVKQSSWIRRLEQMNSVHQNHDKDRFMENRRHFIFAFHDSIFECVARDFTISRHAGSLTSSISQILSLLKEDPY